MSLITEQEGRKNPTRRRQERRRGTRDTWRNRKQGVKLIKLRAVGAYVQ